MRIGIDARPLTNPFSGIGRYTQSILSRIVDSDHEYFLYSHAPLPPQHANCQVRHALSKPRQALGSLIAQLYFPRWAKRDQLDVFWSPRHHLPVTLGVPAVVTVHDMVWRIVPETMAPLGRLLERTLMPHALHKAQKIIAVSQSTKQDIIAFQPELADKIAVIRGAGQIEQNSGSDEIVTGIKTPFVLFVGTAEPRKNIRRTLAAFLQVRRHTSIPHKLVLVSGPGWNFDLADCLQSLGTREDEITHYPSRTDAQLADLYAACDFLVLPSLYEGFGLPLAEAMNFGKPCITSNIGAMAEVVGEAGILVDPQSEASIAAAIKTLAQDNTERQRLGEVAKRRSLEFSWDKAARETLAVLEQCGRSKFH